MARPSAAWLVQRYESLAQLSMEMLEAARQGRWDELTGLEGKRSILVSELSQDSNPGEMPVEISSRVAELIRKILEADAETTALAGSWQEELQGLLKSMSTERKLSDTYGV